MKCRAAAITTADAHTAPIPRTAQCAGTKFGRASLNTAFPILAAMPTDTAVSAGIKAANTLSPARTLLVPPQIAPRPAAAPFAATDPAPQPTKSITGAPGPTTAMAPTADTARMPAAPLSRAPCTPQNPVIVTLPPSVPIAAL